MTTLAKKNEAVVYNNRMVRPGDSVELLPVDLREKDENDGDYFARLDYEHLLRWLGKGPYKIAGIKIFPCGKTMLYLEGADQSRPGAFASDFM